MKTFLAVYIGTAESRKRSGWDDLPEAERKQKQAEGMRAWTQWVEVHRASLAEIGAPLGKTKRVSRQGVEDIRNNLAAFTLVRAESHEDAARLFENHPHFMVFPGDSVEIMECLPLPTTQA